MKHRLLKIIFWCIWALGGGAGVCLASSGYIRDTSLLFVGEDEKVLTIASRREESAWQVPAVASVIERDEIREAHLYTLADALDTLPGFHVEPISSGTKVYLRGISNSAMILYDTVPLGLSTEKSLNLIDNELPLNSVKRIEVVQGPGSVLWGPDAFAGIVNVVPLTGRDFSGAETGVMHNSEKSLNQAYMNLGKTSDSWDGFLSLTGSRTEEEDYSRHITHFFAGSSPDTPVSVEERRGTNEDFGSAVDVVGNLQYKSLFSVSGRFSDSVTPYSLATDETSWKEVRDTRSGFLKMEGKHQFDLDSTLRFAGTVSMLENEKQITDLDLKQKEKNYYGELTYEKTFNSGQSHLASGLSYRDTEHSGVPVWDAYLPAYLVDENDNFLPGVSQYDYTTRLWSVFGQYRASINRFELMAGVRYDHHDTYENKVSYNAGVVWTPSESWVVKGLLGTAYRTPNATQLVYESNPPLEEIKSLNLQTIYKPDRRLTLSWCAFVNSIDNHVTEDPYAGLSSPNSQEIRGMEAQAEWIPIKSLSIKANATLLSNSGPDESFRYVEYYLPDPDGNLVPQWGEISYPYDMGPERLFNLKASWSPEDWITVFCRTRYFSSYKLTYPYADSYEESGNAWLVDAGVTFKDIGVENSEWGMTLSNIFDTSYLVPGTYSLEQGQPFTISLFWRKRW